MYNYICPVLLFTTILDCFVQLHPARAILPHRMAEEAHTITTTADTIHNSPANARELARSRMCYHKMLKTKSAPNATGPTPPTVGVGPLGATSLKETHLPPGVFDQYHPGRGQSSSTHAPTVSPMSMDSHGAGRQAADKVTRRMSPSISQPKCA